MDRYYFRDPNVPDRGNQAVEIFDRRAGFGKPIARCTDVAIAEDIVGALNAMVRMQAAVASLAIDRRSI